ncbi:MAG TPA: hypothetical protein VNO83_08260 [Pseudonocardia sp.]|nr:hypothetical protein [Pseudonocardia sp.]
MGSGTLDVALTELLVQTGAGLARVLDSRSGTVLAQVGSATPDDVPTLGRLAAAASTAGAGEDGLVDMVLCTGRAVHVFREPVPGRVLHVRLDGDHGDLTGPDLAGVALIAARRELAAVALDKAVCATLGGAAAPPVAEPELPPGAGGGTGGQPALAVLDAGARRRRSGELAAVALGELVALPRRSRSDSPRPGLRPSPSSRPATPPVLQQAWANDAGTLRRLLSALRQPDDRSL